MKTMSNASWAENIAAAMNEESGLLKQLKQGNAATDWAAYLGKYGRIRIGSETLNFYFFSGHSGKAATVRLIVGTPDDRNGYGIDGWPKEPCPSINVGRTKSPKVAARDILKRLVAPGLPWVANCRAALKRHDDANAKQYATCARIAQDVGGSAFRAYGQGIDNPNRVAVPGCRCPDLIINGDSIRFESGPCCTEKAPIEILRILQADQAYDDRTRAYLPVGVLPTGRTRNVRS